MKKNYLMLVFILFAMLGISTSTLHAQPTALNKKAAFVVSSTELTAGFDGAVFDRLLSTGYDVTVVTAGEVKDGSFSMAAAESKDLLVISESIGSGDVVNLAGAAVPILHMESYGWPKMGWTEYGTRGWVDLNGYIDIAQTKHTILSKAGLDAVTDSIQLFTVDSLAATGMNTEFFPAGTKFLATKNDSSVISWGIEKGDSLANATTAAARIAAFPLPGYGNATYEASVMTDEGWAFFDAAVAWLGAAPSDFIGSAAFVASDPLLTAGFDGAVFDRLLSTGYDVTVVTAGEVKDGSFSVAAAESKDLLVISESIGSGDVVNLTGAAVPILHMESYGWPKMGWTEYGTRGWVDLNGYIDIAQTKHTILSNAGLDAVTDSIQLFTVDSLAATGMNTEFFPAGTKFLATKNDSSVISWGIEKGDSLANATTAAARIAAFPLPGYGNATYEASVMTDEGWAFFDAAVAWLGAAPSDFIGSAAFVASDPGLTAGFDGAVFDRLLSTGYDVTVVTAGEVKDGSFSMAAAESKDLLVISESIGSGDVVNLAGAAVPILHMESYGWPKMGWTEYGTRGWVDLNGYIDIAQTKHTILSNAGLDAVTDSIQLFTVDSLAATGMNTEFFPAGTKFLATKNDSSVISWGIEKGDSLANATTAAARIAAFPLPGYGNATYEASVMTDEGWAFFDAAVAWLGAAPSDFIGSAAFVASDPLLTAGFDGAVFDRLLSTGYDVTVVTAGEVKDGSFSVAAAESKDLLVISESIGSGDVVNLTGAAVPILHMESYGWPKMGWTEYGTRGWVDLNGYIDIAQTKHTILSNAGLDAVTDSIQLFTVDSLAATGMNTEFFPAGTKFLATKNDSSVISWGIEKGDSLANATTAAARIAAFPLPGYGNATYEASVMTDEGWAFFDAAVAWLGAAPSDFIASTAFIASDPGLTAGFDGVVFDRLLSLGYDVTVVTAGEVKGGSFSKAAAESKDLLVVSESIGSGDIVNLAGAAVPILHMESYGWPKMGWTEYGTRGWVDLNGYIDIAQTRHTILSNAGLAAVTDSIQLFTVDSLAATGMNTEFFPAGTKFLASKNDSSIISWTMETGDSLANGTTAAARIAAFPLPGYGNATYEASVMTDEGWAFFDAAILWLTPPPSTGEIEPGIVSRYEFEIGTGDKQGNFDGSIMGDAAIVADPERGKVLSLTEDGYLSIDPALANELMDFSITTWMKGLGTAETGGLFGIGQSEAETAGYWDIHLGSNGTMSFASSKEIAWPPDGCAQTVDDFVNPGDDWYHIAVTFKNGEGAMVYINGEAQTTSDWIGDNDFDVSPMNVAAQMVAIGKDAYNQSTLTNTLIDNFTVYNIAISEAVVQNVYNTEMHIPAPKLVAEYVFDYDAKDATGKYDGTLEGDATLVRDDDRGAVLALTSDGYVSLPPGVTDVLDDFSIAAWVKGVASSGTPALLGMGSGTAQTVPYWDIQLNGDGTMSYAASLANATEPDGCHRNVVDVTNDGSAWIHIVLAFAKDEGAAVYINGEVVSDTAVSGENDFSVSPSDLGAAMVAIGRDAFNQNILDNTLIDDFKIYKNAINADDVKEIYQSEIPKVKPGGGFGYSLNTSVLYANAGADFDNYDGFWAHENGNDLWDGSGIGEGAPGGISIVDDFYRIQDAGNPSDHGFTDKTNQKLQGYCDLGAFGGSPTMLDDGATVHFVARIPTPADGGPLDDLYNPNGTVTPYPATGDGYVHHNDGAIGMIGIKQGEGGYIAFTLRAESDTLDHDLLPCGKFVGLQLQPAVGSSIITGGKITAADTINTIKLDPTEWHDFWINIEKDATGVGTHKVSVSVDGGLFQSFSVTATNHENHPGMSVLRMGLGASDLSGAMDIKAFDFAPGLLPAPAIPNAHWRMNGDATDVYGTSDGTLVGGDTTSYVEGLEGQGLALDLPGGTEARYIEVPDNEVVNLDSTSFTFSMLVQAPDYAGDRELVFKGHNDDAVDGHWFALAIHDNTLVMYVDDKVTKTQWENPNIGQALIPGEWNHLVAIRDRAQQKLFLYINGVEYKSTVDLTQGSLSSSYPFRIGSNHNEKASEPTMMDEVQLFNAALSAEEVANLYATYVAQLPGNLKAYWKLDGDALDYFEISDGTLVGGDAANYVPGNVDQALDLSIGPDPVYVEVADNDVVNVGAGEFTYSLLLKISDFDSDRKILYKGASAGASLALALDGTDLSLTIDDGTNETSVVLEDAPLHLYDDGWNHIAATRDRVEDSIYLYINKRMVASAQDNTEGIGSVSSLIIGAGESMDVKFDGMLDDIRLYDPPLFLTDLGLLTGQYGIDAKYIPSSNAYLTTIMVAPIAPLSPAFARDVFEYTCALPAGTESVTVSALPEDFKSTITGTGSVDVSSGTGTAELVVTAENGTVNTYTIEFSVATGIDEDRIADLNVIYNPLENCLIFENRDYIKRVEILNITGSKLYVQEDISSGRLNLNPANLQSNAVYIARIYAGDNFSILKFVKMSSY